MKRGATHRKQQQGKAQVIRVSRESHARRRAGETLRSIFEDLTARGEITIPMRTFTRWVTRLENDETYEPLPSAPQQFLASHSEQTYGRRSEASASAARSPTNPTLRYGPRHGVVGVQRPKPINTTINTDDLY